MVMEAVTGHSSFGRRRCWPSVGVPGSASPGTCPTTRNRPNFHYREFLTAVGGWAMLLARDSRGPTSMATIQVILTEKIEGLGAEADIVKVHGGYARNFLLPKGLALEASRGNLNQTEKLKAKRAIREAAELKAAEDKSSAIRKLVIQLELTTGQTGKTFGAITAADIAKAVEEQSGIVIDRHDIVLEKPIKQTGEFKVDVHIHGEINSTLTVVVSPKA